MRDWYENYRPSLQITTPGRLNDVIIGLPLNHDDSVQSESRVEFSVSNPSIVIRNQKLNAVAETIGSYEYLPKQAITFDIEVSEGIKASNATLYITFETIQKARSKAKFDIRIYSYMPPAIIDARVIPLGIGVGSFVQVATGSVLPTSALLVGELFIKTGVNPGLYWALDLVGNWEGPLSG